MNNPVPGSRGVRATTERKTEREPRDPHRDGARLLMDSHDDRHLAWDLPLRLFHWTLVALIALQYASGEFDLIPMSWHYWFGYATLTLVVFRVLWGVGGSQTSRFSDFVRGPRGVIRHVVDMLNGRAAARLGHNPLGGWSVVLMLASVGVQAVSGLFSSDDIMEQGPLFARVSSDTVEWMTRIHHLNRYVLAALIVLHIAAIALHRVIRNENLVAPMLHGRTRLADARGVRPVSSWRALILLALSAASVWAVVAWGEAV